MTSQKNKIVVLISNTGTGSNLKAIIDGIEQSGDALAQFQNDELSPEDVTYNFYPEYFSGN